MSEVGALCISAHASTESALATPPFGIYRLATDEWQQYARAGLAAVEEPAQAYLDASTTPEFANSLRVNDAFAATFVQRGDMLARPDREALQFDKVLERVGNLAASSRVLTVPITGLAWSCSRIAALLDTRSSEYAEVLVQRRELSRILGEAALPNAPVRRPGHVSLCRRTNIRLRRVQQRELLAMVHRQVAALGMGSVELGVTIVGNNYKDPFTLGDWAM